MPSISQLQHAVLRLPPNLLGRDFATADIHGSFDLFYKALDRVRFNGNVDRVFIGGDLISRGTKSHLCAQTLKMPGVFSVRGNHEAMLLSLYKLGIPNQEHLEIACKVNGFNWWLSASNEVRKETLIAINQLPLAIEVATSIGPIGIIHAEVPLNVDWHSFLSDLQNGNHIAIRSCLWGRNRYFNKDGSTTIEGSNATKVNGIARLFVGHNRQMAGLQIYENVIAIDTGAVYAEINKTPGARLTLVEITSSYDALLNENLIDYIDIRQDVIAKKMPVFHERRAGFG